MSYEPVDGTDDGDGATTQRANELHHRHPREVPRPLHEDEDEGADDKSSPIIADESRSSLEVSTDDVVDGGVIERGGYADDCAARRVIVDDRDEDDEDDEEEDSSFEARRITWFDASMHLMKGNLGPGCLNLPHAFALAGWRLGMPLFALVASQGVYSMVLLTYCKQILVDRGGGHHGEYAHTFMDVARLTLGQAGGRVVQIFLFVLQGGVCCVFLSLISTNLRAQAGGFLTSDVASVVIVTLALLGIVLLRFIRDLRWLSATANVFMIVAIFTAAIAGILEVVAADDDPDREASAASRRSTSSSSEDVATFISSMFFSFEGIGLVLPVENGYTSYPDPSDSRRANTKFRYVLVGSMSTVAVLFAFVGVSASIGFPDVHDGSITAYLERRYPENPWYGIVNGLVMVAVFFTFPLQLAPAMEVLDEWFGPGCRPRCGGCWSTGTSSGVAAPVPLDENADDTAYETHKNGALIDSDDVVSNEEGGGSSCSCLGLKEWMFRRWSVVLCCAAVVLLVDDLSLLMSLFGAVGQTGLAAMPCVVHLEMQRRGIAPRCVVASVVDVCVVGFCLAVMVTGLASSVDEIVRRSADGP